MSAMAKVLGDYAVGHTITHGGTDFVFGRITHEMAAALELAYFERLVEGLEEIKGKIGERSYDRQLGRITDNYTRNQYAFPIGESFAYYMQGGGLAELVEQLTGRDFAACEKLCGEMPVRVMHVCLCVTTESFPDLKKKILKLEEKGGEEFEEMAKMLALFSE